MTGSQHQQLPLRDDALAQLFAPHDTSALLMYGPDDDDVMPSDSNLALASLIQQCEAADATLCAFDATQEVDEAQLLAETEELLGILEPMAFADPGSIPTANGTASIGPSSSLLGSDSSVFDSDSSTPASRTAKPRNARNLSRERRQSELAALRKQVVVLEHALRDAHELRAVAPSSPHSVQDVALDEREAMVMTPKWRRIAKRQLVGCERALAENKRLRTMLATQTQLITNIQEALYSWQHAAPQSSPLAICNDGLAAAHTPPVQLKPDDMVLLELLVAELDTAFLHVGEIFRSAGIDELGERPLARTRAKTETTHSGALRSFVELVEIEVAPFAFDIMRRVTQRCSERQSQSPDCVEYHGSWDADDTFAEKYRIAREHAGTPLELVMLTAMKEFAFDGRVVVVWRSIFKSESPHFPDAYVQELGSCVSRARRASNDTLTKSVVQFEPKLFAQPTHVVRADSDALTALVMSAYRDDMNELDALMDNMLLDESMRRATLTASPRVP